VIEVILKYIDQTEKTVEFFGADFKAFVTNDIYFNALSMEVFQIAENSIDLSDDVKFVLGEIPWRAIRGMRNWFAHRYGSMNPADIWEVVNGDLPSLKLAFNKLLTDDSEILDLVANGRNK
jgi:uncharacterized protein with HEPN domain